MTSQSSAAAGSSPSLRTVLSASQYPSVFTNNTNPPSGIAPDDHMQYSHDNDEDNNNHNVGVDVDVDDDDVDVDVDVDGDTVPRHAHSLSPSSFEPVLPFVKRKSESDIPFVSVTEDSSRKRGRPKLNTQDETAAQVSVP